MRRELAAAAVAAALAGGCDRPAGPPVPRSSPPVAVDTPPPGYPEALACDDIGGTANLSVTIGTDGKPSAIVLRGSSGSAELDESAAAAVRGWTFRPATRAGAPAAATIAVPIRFTPPRPRPDFCFALDEERRTRL